MLRSWFIDEAIVARFKPKDAAAFRTQSNGLHISRRRGAHKMSSRCFQLGENYFFKKYLPSKNKGALFGLRQQRSMLARLSLSALRREGLKCLAVFKCAFLRASFLSWCA